MFTLFSWVLVFFSAEERTQKLKCMKITVDFYVQMRVYFLYDSDGFSS